MPDTHHTYSPSTLKNRAICPGWINDPYSDKSKADEGTRLHHAAETGNLAGLDPEQTTAVQKCLGLAAKMEKGADKVLNEQRLQILDGLTFGTADKVIHFIARKHAVVLDWKFGKHDVDPAKKNLQGKAYALGVFDLPEKPETVRVIFALPRLNIVHDHTFTRSEMSRLSLEISAIIARCRQYDETNDVALLNPTDYGCLYCGRKATCPHTTSLALGIVQKYEPLSLPENLHSSQLTDPKQMARLVDFAKIAEKLASSIKEHAMQLAIEQGGLHDEAGNLLYEVAERNGERALNLGLALPILSQHLDDRELLSVAKVSLPAALKLIEAKAPRGQKSKVRAAIEQALGDAQAVTSGTSSRYLKKAKKTEEEAIDV